MSKLNIISAHDSEDIAINTLITHGGFFHADEVATTAILELLATYQWCGAHDIMEAYTLRAPIEQSLRSTLNAVDRDIHDDYSDTAVHSFPVPILRLLDFEKDLPEDERDPGDFIYDIGLGEFDHHQKNAVCHHGTKQKYCALSLVWSRIMMSKWVDPILNGELKTFNELFITPIEDSDTNGTKTVLSIMVSSYTRNAKTEAERTTNFCRAVADFMRVLHEWFMSMGQRSSVVNHLRDIMEVRVNEETGAVYAIFPEDVQPSIAAGVCPEQCIAITYPSARGGWAVRSLDDVIGNGKIFNRFQYPQEIRDNPSMIPGMTFCHPGGFYGSFEAKEYALGFLVSKYLVPAKS